MDYGILISSILGSAGVFSLVQYMISRHDKKNDEFAQIKKELKIIKSVQDETILRVTRMELLHLLEKQPTNTDAILHVAEYYFIELNGNAYAHALFEKWAVKHNVAIGWLPKLKEGNNYETQEKNH